MDVNPEAWEKSISSLGHQLVEALKPVAEKLGVAAEHMYVVMVRQSLVDSLANIVGWGIFCFFLLFIGYRVRKEANNEKSKLLPNDSDKEGAWITSWFVTTIGIIILSIAVGTNLSGILNPEYGAIKTLLDSVKTTSCK